MHHHANAISKKFLLLRAPAAGGNRTGGVLVLDIKDIDAAVEAACK